MGKIMRVNVFIDGANKFGPNKFVHGKILGYCEAICTTSGMRRGWRDFGDSIGITTTVWATEDEYLRLRNTVDKFYPGLCRFSIVDLVEGNK